MESVIPTQEELFHLAAVDPIFYSEYFFPKAARQKSPSIHSEAWTLLEKPGVRYASIMLPRGFAKTTLARLCTSKRIAYGQSRTIMYIGKSEGHATRSLDWVRRNIQNNRHWTDTFGLRPGKKFQGVEAEIVNETLGQSIWLVGMGITGSVRGVNFDDFRPDFILLDDVIAEDNSSTPESQQKLTELILGAVKESLAPASEAPDAKLVMVNTPIMLGDASLTVLEDPEWVSLRLSCWTKETEHLDLMDRESSWPERYSSEVLREEKRHAILRGQAHIFNREKECRITSRETSPLKVEWLKDLTTIPEREEVTNVIITIDPVPKPTEAQIAKNLHGKDYEVIQVWARDGKKIICVDYARNRGHNPSWTIAKFFEFVSRWRPRKCRIDATAYQSTLAWLLEEAMHVRGLFIQIDEVKDKRSKYDKIVDALSGPGYAGSIYVPKSYTEFWEQWQTFPAAAHDDDLDAAHLAVEELNSYRTVSPSGLPYEDEEEPPLMLTRSAP